MKSRRQTLRLARKPLALALAAIFSVGAQANPSGAAVVSGSASISQSGNVLTVSNSPNSIINWQSFGIQAGETTRFLQQSSSSAVLNRVVGADPSQLLGTLQSNGRVFLVNPAGILVGQGARIDVAGLVASTLNLGNQEFLTGKLNFQATPGAGSVVNQGRITTPTGGSVYLVAPKVENSGIIQAPNGEVMLAAGQTVQLLDSGNPGVAIEITGQPGNVTNLGKILADSGRIGLQGALVINQGQASADSVVSEGGRVLLRASNVLNTGRLSANGTAGGSVAIEASGSIVQTASAELRADASSGAGGAVKVLSTADGNVFSSATLSATGQSGGQIDVSAGDVKLFAARLDASGTNAGGSIHVGGGWQGSGPLAHASTVQVNAATELHADASGQGNGGEVVVWSDGNTRFDGRATAKGGASGGAGGRIEVSSKEALTFSGQGDASAPQGQGGKLLLDPKNITVAAANAGISYIDLANPHPSAGNQHGSNSIVELANGNIVVSSNWDQFGAYNGGAVYLYNGTSGALISALYGGSNNDWLGLNGITKLSNGNFVITTNTWHNAAGASVGAVTWGSASSGVSGLVSASNSLVGSLANDNLGAINGGMGVTALGNGNYVVASSYWNGRRGAVTWGNGASGSSGVVSATNSLVGSSVGDAIGYNGSAGLSGVTVLSNNNYVVASSAWNGNLGAVTWGSGTSGVTGAVAASNSLVGSTAGDLVGGNGVTALANGNYLVSSPKWNAVRGAVTWGDGTTGVWGAVGASNSLVGSAANDNIGSGSGGPYVGGITLLGSSNYLVNSPNWSAGMGAVTWGSGSSGVSGAVAAGNSLVGSSAGDAYNRTVTVLSNGNYVVSNPAWGGGRGAATLGFGNSGITGTIGDGLVAGPAGTIIDTGLGNSMLGGASDLIGSGGVVDLGNGKFVLVSPSWGFNGWARRGAVTLLDGSASLRAMQVNATTSLVGSTNGANSDSVGSGGVTVLANHNYVVKSPSWGTRMGAVTWGSGSTGVTGLVSASNSLVGITVDDYVGGASTGNASTNVGVLALSNGNYLVNSWNWNGNRGAVTWGSGSTGVSGVVSAGNSLVGGNANDSVGYATPGYGYVTELGNGNYVVQTDRWNGYRGAVTWGSGTAGVTGVLAPSNSLVGSNANDHVGNGGVTALTNGNYVVKSTLWNGASGAVTWGNGSSGISGAVSAANSLVGSSAGDTLGSAYDPVSYLNKGVVALGNGNYLVDSPSWNGSRGAVTWANGSTGISGSVSAANSLVGGSPGDRIGYGLDGKYPITLLSNGNYVVLSSGWNGSWGAASWGSASAGVSGVVSASNSLLGVRTNNYVGYYGVTALGNGNYVVANAGDTTWGDGTTGTAGTVSASNSLLGTNGAITRLGNNNFIVKGNVGGVPGVMLASGSSALSATAASAATFASNAGGDVTLTPATLTAITNTGTAVTLQANNDISVNSAITSSAGGSGGALTLQAGRSILLNASISTDNGNFSATAGDPGANAAYRDAGTATLSLASGATLNVGSGTATLAAVGGNLNIDGNVNAGTLTLNDGTWSQVAATLPGLSAGDFRIAGGSFVRALGGDGSPASPYRLADSYGVQGMGSTGMLGKSYTLANNIDATSTANWNGGAGLLPVGNASSAFTGSLDGLNHTLNNLTVQQPYASYVGLFGSVGAGGAVSNLGLVGANINGLQYVGALAGANAGTVSASYATGTVNSFGSVTPNTFGPIFAYSSFVGGLVGSNSGTLSNSSAAVSVSSTLNNYSGGLAGINGGTISASHASGTVTVSDVTSGSTTYGSANAGGLLGSNGGTLTTSYASGNVVSGLGSAIGGLTGSNGGTLTTSYASGNVTSGVNSFVSGSEIGGLIGKNQTSGVVSDSYATGAVDSARGSAIGGLVGRNQGSVNNSYSTSSVSGQSKTGGVVGWNKLGSVGNSYWNSSTAGAAVSFGVGYDAATLAGTNAGAAGLSSAQMMQATSFTGWSLANSANAGTTWRIYEGNSAPLLANFLTPLTVSTVSGSKVYDGTLPSLSVSYSPTPDMSKVLGTASYSGAGSNAGSYTVTPGGLYSNQQGYDIGYASGTLTITPASLSAISLSGTRVYDGTVNVDASIFKLSGLASGENLTLSGVGSIADPNVGTNKPVALGSLTLGNGSNGLASNYTLSGGTRTVDITVRPLSTWIGRGDGLWSDPANWDALPSGNNVLAASIPSGQYTVTYNAGAGSTHLQTLSSGQNIFFSGGSLDVSGQLSSTDYVQKGGNLTGGSLSVSDSFGQTGGSIVLSGAATLTQAQGKLNVGSLSASSVSLSAPTGVITQSGPLVTDQLSTLSAMGTTLSADGNRIRSFSASNSGGDDIVLANGVALTLAGISNNGNVSISNTAGDLRLAQPLTAGNATLVASAGDILGDGSVTARNVTLEAAGGIGIGAPVRTATDASGMLRLVSHGVGSAGNISVIESNAIDSRRIALSTDASAQTVSLSSPLTSVSSNFGDPLDDLVFGGNTLIGIGLSGSGRLINAAGAAMTLNPSNALTIARPVLNLGALDWASSGTSPAASVTLTGGLSNAAGATVTLPGFGSPLYFSATVHNAGTMSIANFLGLIDNTGTVELSGGSDTNQSIRSMTLHNLAGGTVNSRGAYIRDSSIDAQAGSTLTGSRLSLYNYGGLTVGTTNSTLGVLELNGTSGASLNAAGGRIAGSIQLDDKSSVSLNAATSNAADGVTLRRGSSNANPVLNVNTNASIGSLVLYGGEVRGNGDLSLSRASTISGGTLTGTGKLINDTTGTLTLNPSSALTIDRPVVNRGKLAASSGSTTFNAGFTNEIGATLEFEARSSSDYGKVKLAGTASLDGKLKFVTGAQFVSDDKVLTPMTYASKTGSFATSALPAGYKESYLPDRIEILKPALALFPSANNLANGVLNASLATRNGPPTGPLLAALAALPAPPASDPISNLYEVQLPDAGALVALNGIVAAGPAATDSGPKELVDICRP
ncbi:MAG: filamentous hemagglutinin N-terminal domain-containing protein [Rhodoferax sp.]|uniref:two-partner secretion domain-containing protein n=1 Tax=Rhodoferax sp. TaxID=50421 RepID=UPI002606E341|nr:filamentous hemagglutinin N-terminal domain-containing protein [Rhodoferax sp.]MDD5334120.1 filamentous hemagglutinin N-terminal domain-containing protein [Rhodoferax sp.]